MTRAVLSHRLRAHRKLVQNQTDMDGQPPAVEVIRLVAEQIEKLTIHEGGHKIESAVRIRKDHKQRRLLVAQGIQFQFVILQQVPQLLDIEGSKPGTAGNENGF